MCSNNGTSPDDKKPAVASPPAAQPTMKLAGILPGLGHYDSATTSDSNSSSSDSEPEDIRMGKRAKCKVVSG